MGKFSLVPYVPEHAITLWQNGNRQKVATIGLGMVEEKAVRHAAEGVAFTLLKDDEIIGCGGVDIKGTDGLAWILFSFDVTRYSKTAMRVTKTALEGIIEQNGLNQVHALINSKDVAAQAWAYVLGFTYQPSIPKQEAIDGNTYLTYRRAA